MSPAVGRGSVNSASFVTPMGCGTAFLSVIIVKL